MFAVENEGCRASGRPVQRRGSSRYMRRTPMPSTHVVISSQLLNIENAETKPSPSGVKLLGSSIRSIRLAEDREQFHDAMVRIGLDVPVGGFVALHDIFLSSSTRIVLLLHMDFLD